MPPRLPESFWFGCFGLWAVALVVIAATAAAYLAGVASRYIKGK